MLLHLPAFPSILKFIIIHQPVHILSVLLKPLAMRKNAVFYRNRIITLIFPFTEIIFKAYTTLVSTIIYHKFT